MEVHVVVPEDRVRTVEETLGDAGRLYVNKVPAFERGDLTHPFASTVHFTKELEKTFVELGVDGDDIVYTCSDFHVDTLPALRLKKKFGFKWIAVQFLFVPSFFGNLFGGYGFPVFKYILVWWYSNFLFSLAKTRADAFVITNDSDRKHFSGSFQKKVFAFYGGVNTNQIPQGKANPVRDVVFCSRLHPQKGIWGFLDVWKTVLEKYPAARLCVIGNGAPEYEEKLKRKAERLGIAPSVDWLGYVNNEAKYEIYRSSRVMVHPTVFDNNGMVAAEALCSALPVVMYDLKPLRKIYTEGCVKVPFGDKKAFAGEVVRLLTDEKVRAGTAPSGEMLERLRSRWDWGSRVSAFEEWMKECGLCV
jgi:glycosyltransferase involved in cell wall biosynthesis